MYLFKQRGGLQFLQVPFNMNRFKNLLYKVPLYFSCWPRCVSQKLSMLKIWMTDSGVPILNNTEDFRSFSSQISTTYGVALCQKSPTICSIQVEL